MMSTCFKTISALALFLRSFAIAVLDTGTGDGNSCCSCCPLPESAVSGVVVAELFFDRSPILSAVELVSTFSSGEASSLLFRDVVYFESHFNVSLTLNRFHDP